MSDDLIEVKVLLPRQVYNWFCVVAKKDGVDVAKVIKEVLNEVYDVRSELRDIKSFYNVVGLSDITSLGQVLDYTLNLGLVLHDIAEHLLSDLEGSKNFVLSDIKLVEEKPGAYKGIYFEFFARGNAGSNIDYFTLQIQHDGLYLDAISTLSFDSKRKATEALRRLKRAAVKIVGTKEVKAIESKLHDFGGKFNIDISCEGTMIYLTFMAYADDVKAFPKLPQIDHVLKMICDEAGIERLT